jgi:hypothetical protein
MKWRSGRERRIVWALTVGLGLILLASGILVFAEATAIPDEAKRCAPSIWQSQWPRYLGCAMTTHDGLAGGLIAAGGALFAVWLALLWQIYSRRFSMPIHFRQCGHRFDGS